MPTEWKKASTVLAHKKGSNDNPSNFVPITLVSVSPVAARAIEHYGQCPPPKINKKKKLCN